MLAEPRRGESFLTSVLFALAFPLRPAWLIPLVLIPVLDQSSASLTGAFSPVGIATGILTSLYTLGLVQTIVRSTARGVDLVLPNFTWSSAFGGLLRTIFGWLLLLVVCLGPFVFVHHHTPGHPHLEQALLMVGLAYFPMGLLAMLQTNRVSSANPVNVVSSVSRAPLAYALTVLLLLPHFYLAAGIDSDRWAAAQPDWIKLLLHLLLEFGALYFALFWARVLGSFYRCHRQRLDWESRIGEMD